MRVEAKRIGLARDSEEFRTNTARLAQFAAAIGDTNPRHRSGEIASPVFNHIPVMQSLVEILEQVTKGFVLHGEHDFIFHRPIVPGQRLFSKSSLVGIDGSAAGAIVVVRSDLKTHDGEPVSTQYSTLLMSDMQADAAGTRPERPRLPRMPVTRSSRFAIPMDLTFRYAEAARDYSPYTLDAEAARDKGLPHPIVHGMCTLALIARAVVEGPCDGETRRLRRLGCRFSRPLYLVPDQVLDVDLWSDRTLSGFEARDRNGDVVVKNGYAEVRQ